MKLTPRTFIAGFIGDHEGGLSLHPADNGNWFDPLRYKKGLPQRRGLGTLVGSKFGITAYTLASYTGKSNITAADIKAITFDMAVDIGVALYVTKPGFDKLLWNRVTASIIDKGWLSGPTTAVKMVQRMLGVTPDGQLGPKTADAYAKFIAIHGEEDAARLWCNVRTDFDHNLATNEGPNDPDRVFLNGWNNRSRSFLPGTKWWINA